MLGPSVAHERHTDGRLSRDSTTPRRPIVLGLAVAALATAAVVGFVALTNGRTGASVSGPRQGEPAPEIFGVTLDGTPIRLSDLRGHPLIVNFWGPSCIPCRDEFPLFKQKLTEHAADGLQIMGVLMDDPPDPARAFVAQYQATWPTVVDPNGAIKGTYRVVGRPQSYFIDRTGIVRSIQIGELLPSDFEKQYAAIR
jgi:cytochrome c biogenesis protein CcmG/thiol:disulfide interchange protein DsbE